VIVATSRADSGQGGAGAPPGGEPGWYRPGVKVSLRRFATLTPSAWSSTWPTWQSVGHVNSPDGKAVTEFVADAAKGCGVGATRNRVKGLRSLLRYMHLEGIIDNLVDAVPTVADWRDSRLPKAPDPGHLARLLAICRDTVAGRRDHAILVLLARMGLRAGEVAALKMEDVIVYRPGVCVVSVMRRPAVSLDRQGCIMK
jgi:site-specific recombinase XerC